MDKNFFENNIKQARAEGAPAIVIEAMELYVESMALLEKIGVECDKPQHKKALKALDITEDPDHPEWLNAEIAYFTAQGDTQTAALIAEYKQTMRDFQKAETLYNTAMDSTRDELDTLNSELDDIYWDLESIATKWRMDGGSAQDKENAGIIYETIQGMRPKKILDTASYFADNGQSDVAAQFNRAADIISEIGTIQKKAIKAAQNKSPKP